MQHKPPLAKNPGLKEKKQDTDLRGGSTAQRIVYLKKKDKKRIFKKCDIIVSLFLRVFLKDEGGCKFTELSGLSLFQREVRGGGCGEGGVQ